MPIERIVPAAPFIRIAVVEDDVDFQRALTSALENSKDMILAGTASTRAQGLAMLEGPPADVLVVDLGLPDGSGIDVIRRAHVRWPACGVMVSTVFGDEARVMQSIEAGASGYLLKDGAPADMVAEIRSLHAGGSPISPLIARQILLRFRQKPGPAAVVAAPADCGDERVTLSAREKEVLEYVAKGFTSAEIAGLMCVSYHTVLTYVRRIYAKLKVSSKTEAIHEARAHGLLT